MALIMTSKCSYHGNLGIIPTSCVPRARARPVSRQGYVAVTAFSTQTTDRGASGLDVKVIYSASQLQFRATTLRSAPTPHLYLQGMRPTSPAAWEIMRNILRERKVNLDMKCGRQLALAYPENATVLM